MTSLKTPKVRVLKPKPVYVHKDILGRELSIGSPVAVSRSNDLYLCKVVGFTPKMVKVEPIKKRWSGDSSFLKYGHDVAILQGEEVFMYVLSNA